MESVESLKADLAKLDEQWEKIDKKWDFDALLWDEIDEVVIYSIDDSEPAPMEETFPDYEHIKSVVKQRREIVLMLKTLGVEV